MNLLVWDPMWTDASVAGFCFLFETIIKERSMKSLKFVVFLTVALTFLAAGQNVFAEEASLPDTPSSGVMLDDSLPGMGSEKTTAGIVVGAVTLDGKNYQQIGIRADIPLGKLGIGVDLQILLDEEGKVREEDWDEVEDYLNMLYYLRWDHKGAPFYAKVGALDYSYLGYSNIVNGYSNAIEWPDYKRIGMEMSFKSEKIVGELLVNDYKELTDDRASMVIGTRVGVRPFSKLEIGASIVSDLNEYNGMRDTDDDGYPDEVDQYPYDDNLVTERERLESIGASPGTIQELIDLGELSPLEREDLTDYRKKRSRLTVWGLDAGIPLIEGDFLKVDLYTAYSDIVDYGWGLTLPGFRTRLGDHFSFTAEYRMQSEEFLFGYFNHTYELERCQIAVDPMTGLPYAVRKQDTLKDITDDMQGYLAGMQFNFFKYLTASAQYQNMKGDNEERKSLYGDLIINNKAILYLPTVKGYYAQNNVESLSEWRTPSTLLGYIVQMNIGGATVSVDNKYTFVDRNGDGDVKDDDEMVKSISISAMATF